MAFLKQLNTLIVSITLTLMLAVSAAHAKDQTINDRVMHYRAIDSVVNDTYQYLIIIEKIGNTKCTNH